MRKKHRGFTLIELMVVIAVVGVLAAIAIPSITDYITRTQMSEAFYLVDDIKTPLAEYAHMHGAWPSALVSPSDVSAADTLPAVLGGSFGNFSPQITKGPYPAGTVTYTASVGSVDRKTVEFSTTDAGSTWSCTGGSLPARYRPYACRRAQ